MEDDKKDKILLLLLFVEEVDSDTFLVNPNIRGNFRYEAQDEVVVDVKLQIVVEDGSGKKQIALLHSVLLLLEDAEEEAEEESDI